MQNNFVVSVIRYIIDHAPLTTPLSPQHLGEIIHEKEMIQTEYSDLAGELELTVSELMAARHRIGKLLMHLDRWAV